MASVGKNRRRNAMVGWRLGLLDRLHIVLKKREGHQFASSLDQRMICTNQNDGIENQRIL